MAFLDETGVQNLTAQIKTLANATYAPLSHIHPSKVDAESVSNDIVGGIVNMDGTVGLGSTQQNISSDIDITPSQLTLNARNSNITNSLSLTSTQTTIKNVVTPVDNGDAVPKSYVDNLVSSSIPSAATTNPLMDGTAAIGTSLKWAKGDHRHPTDTTRASQSAIDTATFSDTFVSAWIGAGSTLGQALEGAYNLANSKQAKLVSGTNIKTINGTSLLGNGDITTPNTDNKVAQNNSTAANDFRVLLSNSVSNSSETAAANKSAGLRFMPSTNHLYVGSEGNDAYISVSPRVYVGTYNRYTQDGQTESSTSYGIGVGINNALAYSSYLTVSSLLLQHWDSSRPTGGVPSSTNYVNGFSSLTYEHILFRDYSGKDSLTAESELTSKKLTIADGTDTVTLRPTLIQTSGTVKASESVEVGNASSNGAVTIQQAMASSTDPYNLKFNSVSSRYMALHGTQYSRMYDSGTSGTAPVTSGNVNNTTRNSNGFWASDNTSFSAATKGSAMTREDGFVAKDGSEVVTHNSNGLSWEHAKGTTSSLRIFSLVHSSTVTDKTTYTIDLPYGTYLFFHSRQTTASDASTGMQLVIIGQTAGSSAIIKTTAESGAQISATSGTRSQVEISKTRQGSTDDSTDRIATVTWTVQGLSYRRLIMVRLM